MWEYDIRQNKWWGTNPDFPGTARRYLVSFTIGDSAYVGLGQTAAYSLHDDFYIFNAKTKSWEPDALVADFGERYRACAFSIDNCGYIVGGLQVNHLMNDVWRYKRVGGSGIWEQMHDFPVPIDGGICIYNDERVFVGFGENSESASTLWEYHSLSDTWTEFTKLPSELKTTISSGAILENTELNASYLYFLDNDNYIWELNLSTKIWEKKLAIPDVFLFDDETGGYQLMMTAKGASSIYIGLGYQPYFYVYHPFWDN